jgi:glycosyltransferase involved in cell wall biosynthesis
MINDKCVVNLGLYRTGTTTLSEVVRHCLGGTVYRDFPQIRKKEELRGILIEPAATVRTWWYQCHGREIFVELVKSHNCICDGWTSLLVFLPLEELQAVKDAARSFGKSVVFVGTTREEDAIVVSELHHWVRHDLERKAGFLDSVERTNLEQYLRKRWKDHTARFDALERTLVLTSLRIGAVESWSNVLSPILDVSKVSVDEAVFKTGIQNQNPPLPMQGILVTFRLKNAQGIHDLLDQIEADPLCRYLLVVALDHDEKDSSEAIDFVRRIKRDRSAKMTGGLHILRNEPKSENGIFPICQVWHAMANEAWDKGANWVVLLGDDVSVDCTFHFRAIYSCFLQLQKDFGFPKWFGCPWFNDKTFPGFPTFPVIGSEHRKIFGGLIPENRRDEFVNQDLDPYLQRLYRKFQAAPWMSSVLLENKHGGTDTSIARYERVQAVGWKDWVLDDVAPITDYLKSVMTKTIPVNLLVDVVVPTYRVKLEYLEGICSLAIHAEMGTTFIIVVDNPNALSRTAKSLSSDPRCESLDFASQILEKHLTRKSNNNIRVRCNKVNKGASFSRNRGIDESSAEYILFLDDDVRPEANLMDVYGKALKKYDSDRTVQGIVGMVEFPRRPDLPLKHAAVLMSYLTFMFEISSNPAYSEPAWGVTANLLVRRTSIRFDLDYAKTGGGEDVDFCLRLLQPVDSNRLVACQDAVVHHEFWEGSMLDLATHFFSWAIGDSALFARFPYHCYRSWPNAVETAMLVIVPWFLYFGFSASAFVSFLKLLLYLVMADCIVDMCHLDRFWHKCQLLEYPRPFWFCILAHILANMYVVILEGGRLYSHARRFQIFNLCLRFDWHCGRLPNSRTNFRRTELMKFVGFVAVIWSMIREGPKSFTECNNVTF